MMNFSLKFKRHEKTKEMEEQVEIEKLAEATKIIKEVTEELRKSKIRRFRKKKRIWRIFNR
jgi:hypothetical protein